MQQKKYFLNTVTPQFKIKCHAKQSHRLTLKTKIIRIQKKLA